MLVLTRADIADVLSMTDVIAAVERAHEALARGHAVENSRTAVALPHDDALLIPMAAAVGPGQASGMKLLTDSPQNPGRSLPRQQSLILLLDPHTNAVEAILDGLEITRLRTAAASAVATKYLSRPDSSTLGLIGAGALARAHIAAIRLVRPIRRVVVWSRSEATLDQFALDFAGSSIDVTPAASIQDVAAQADVLCTLTPAQTPILRGTWLRPGTHVNAVGAPPRTGYREIDNDVVRLSRVVVDSLPIALAESGAIRGALDAGAIDLDQVSHDIGQVIAGIAPGRRDDQQITLYNSVGLAIQDLATARILVDLARRTGLGTDLLMSAPDRPQQRRTVSAP